MEETLIILSEECAEVIQAVSKCQRFGMDGKYPGQNKTNKQRLEEEIGDVMALIEILLNINMVSSNSIENAKNEKFKKLSIWSNIKF